MNSLLVGLRILFFHSVMDMSMFYRVKNRFLCPACDTWSF